MTIERKRMYQISGHTNSGTYVTTGCWTLMRYAVAHFIEKYPRFKGRAEITHLMVEMFENGVYMTDYRSSEIIDSFESTKELKEYIK